MSAFLAADSSTTAACNCNASKTHHMCSVRAGHHLTVGCVYCDAIPNINGIVVDTNIF